jgi:hypothetical protein
VPAGTATHVQKLHRSPILRLPSHGHGHMHSTRLFRSQSPRTRHSRDDTDGPDVDGLAVAGLLEDLGRHVPRGLRSAMLMGGKLTPQVVVRMEKFSSSKTLDNWSISSAPPVLCASRTPKSASMRSASSALDLKRMFSGFKSGAVRLGRSLIGEGLTAVHDPLVVEVLDGRHDGAHNVGSVPACQQRRRGVVATYFS